ncbi:MAG: glycosyltransferase family 2 protein [Pseudomonadota bacterium]
MPHFSIVIPTYNDAETLPRTVRSVLAQEYDDFEIVVVNDGGTAPPRAVLEIDDPRLRIVDMDRNSGVSTARNRGTVETTGRILHYLDADDYVAPDLLGFVAAKMAETEAGLLSVGHRSVPAAEIEANLHLLEPRDRTAPVRHLGPVPFYDLFRTSSWMFAPSFLFFDRAALVARCGAEPWNTGLRNAEDTLLILQMGARHGIVHCDDRFAIYSVRPDSLSREPMKNWTGRTDAMDQLVAQLVAEGADPRLVRIARQVRQNSARRVSRLQPDKAARQAVLRDDLRHAFNWKSTVEMLRNEIGLRSDHVPYP